MMNVILCHGHINGNLEENKMLVSRPYTETLHKKGITAEKSIQKKIWVNGKGKQLFVEEMSTEHIKNCINFLSQGSYITEHKDKEHKIPVPKFYQGYEKQYIELFNDELNRRAES